MDIKTEFSLRFQAAAKAHWNCNKPNQKMMSREFEVSQATISDWWNANKMPGLEQLILIAIKLDVCLEWLGTGRGPMKPPCSAPSLTEEQKKMFKQITDLICN